MGKLTFSGLGAALVLGVAGGALADVATLIADRDNTLYELALITDPQVSNGAGQYFFAGRTNQEFNYLRRGLLHFNVSSIPANAVINSATLTLNCSKTVSGPQTTGLHVVQANWGEGTSDAGFQEGNGVAAATANDATWFYRLFNSQQWTTPGGDFNAAASATQSVAGIGMYSWASAQTASDVAAWIANPGTNFGWLVLGVEGISGTAKRFDSRTSPTVANRPKLVVNFTLPPTTGACCQAPAACSITDPTTCGNQGGTFKGLGTGCGSAANPTTCCKANFNGVGGLTVQDLFDFLAAFFATLSSADFNGSGTVTVQDLFDFLAAFFAGCTVV